MAAVDGITTHPLWVRFLIAARINNLLGGAFISPDEVDNLTAEYIELLDAMLDDSSAAKEGMKKVRQAETDFLKRNNYKRRG